MRSVNSMSEAFDKVDKGILAHKIKRGVWKSCKMVFQLLSSRTQIILANRARSSVRDVTSGITQGTHIVPNHDK